MKTFRLSSSGLSGFVGRSFTPRNIVDFASALATYIGGETVVIGRDTRYSSPMGYSAAISGFLNAGCNIIDLGICPTPMIQFAVRHYGASAGFSITGNTKDAGWNSLNMINSEGCIFDPLSGQTILDIFHSKDFLKSDWQGMGKVSQSNSFLEPYLSNLENCINTDAIRAANLTILMDLLGGAGVPYVNSFAKRLGINLVPINGEASGYLAREAEPRPRSAKQIASILPYLKGDAGFLFSSDMASMSLVTETPEPKSEEYTFAVIANHTLSKQKGTIVTNNSTSRMIDDIAAKHKSRLVKTKAGQPYVLTTLADEQGILGGEGDGTAALAKAGLSFDGFIMMALVLEAMAENKVPLSELLRDLPTYHIVKKNVPCTSSEGYRALEYVERLWHQENPEKTINLQDGLRVDYENCWKHVRTSRRERIVRVITESKDREMAEEEAEKVIRTLEEVL